MLVSIVGMSLETSPVHVSHDESSQPLWGAIPFPSWAELLMGALHPRAPMGLFLVSDNTNSSLSTPVLKSDRSGGFRQFVSLFDFPISLPTMVCSDIS